MEEDYTDDTPVLYEEEDSQLYEEDVHIKEEEEDEEELPLRVIKLENYSDDEESMDNEFEFDFEEVDSL